MGGIFFENVVKSAGIIEIFGDGNLESLRLGRKVEDVDF